MNLIQQNQIAISNLCKKFKVMEMYAFGSVLDESKFNDKSDIDLIVKFNLDVPIENYADLYFDLAENLELLLKRKVDLMLQKAISNKLLFENIEETKKLVYEA
jgi:hypothetical protein